MILVRGRGASKHRQRANHDLCHPHGPACCSGTVRLVAIIAVRVAKNEMRKISRRAFVVGTVLVGVGVSVLGRRFLRTLEARADATVQALCDEFVPGHEGAPGAVALGIDRVVAEKCRGTRRGRLALLLLTYELQSRGVFAMNPTDRAAFLRNQIALGADRNPSRDAATLHTIYRECTRRYLTNPDSWEAIRYRTPQPHGYLDYTECVTS